MNTPFLKYGFIIVFLLLGLRLAGQTGKTVGACTADQCVLDVTLFGQEMDQWCWAASGQMVMKYFSKNVDQCDQACKEFGTNTCCNSPDSCNSGGWPEFDKYGFSFKRTSDKAIGWDELVTEINKRRPVAFSWHWEGGGGHMMVAYGYEIVNNVRYIYVYDPWPVKQGVSRIITYEEYVEGDDHSHWDDFYVVSKI